MLRNNQFARFLYVGALLLLLATHAKAQTTGCGRLYVDSTVTTSGNGSSWATAFKTLTQALDTANKDTCSSREIWVRKGTYYPMSGTTAIAGSRDSSFRILRNGIKLYGGFAGTETVLSARNVATNLTVLSGDIGVAGDSTDNCYHVVTVVVNALNIDTNTRIDGFTVTRGNTAGIQGNFSVAGQLINKQFGGGVYNVNSSPSIANCIFSSNNGVQQGGGIYNNSSSPSITSCIFSSNTSIFGGGISNNFSSPLIANCIFFSNGNIQLGTVGGGVYNENSSPQFVNCTFSSNYSYNGGLMHNAHSSPSVKNCIMWGNLSNSGGAVIYNNLSASVTISYSTTETVQAGIGNSIANPLFINAANPIGPDGIWRTSDDGLQLISCSPAINTGNNLAIPAGITTDITGALRIQNTTVDRGAYEMSSLFTGLSSTTVSISRVNPVCRIAAITFTATATVPGSLPAYQWYKNGVAVGTNQSTYTFNSWNDNDSVWVVHTNNDCDSATDTSYSVVVKVAPNLVPTLTVTVAPGTSIPAGTSVTFTANVTAGANNATYQWYKNGIAITGATGSIYTSNILQGGDFIWVQVAALGPCATPNNLTSATLRISRPAGIQTVSGGGNWQESLSLHPNPNTGRFTVTANWGSISAGERVQVEVVNNLGQSVFSREVVLTAGKWDLEVQLNEGVANGLYLLRLRREKDGSSKAKPVLIQR